LPDTLHYLIESGTWLHGFDLLTQPIVLLSKSFFEGEFALKEKPLFHDWLLAVEGAGALRFLSSKNTDIPHGDGG
jgi:hypothetical protein